MAEFELPEGFEYRPTQRKQKELNPRASKCIPNRTNYFNPDSTRTKVRFSSQETFKARKQRSEQYETRLYYEYKWCEDNSGQTFFFTFTYNDAHMPKYMGENCFDYEDLRYLLNGGLKKKLLRNYGTNFHYFVGAELGDGKGERGLANNPHYHILFFLYPDTSVTSYHPISVAEFTHLVREYWQGFDEDTDGYHDYRTAKYGIVRASEEFGALVKDFRACSYAAKYVTKDATLRRHEKKIRALTRAKYIHLDESPEVKEAFWNDVLQPRLNPQDDMAPREFFAEYAYLSSIWTSASTIPEMVTEMCVECNNVSEWYKEYVKSLIDEQCRLVINEYRNRYCNKCRISQGVGYYALKFIADELNPTIPVPTSKGIKYRPIGLYYYRKLYCDVVKDAENRNCYILNQKGIDYRCFHLEENLQKVAERMKANIVTLTPALYEEITQSELNDDVHFNYDVFMNMLNNNEKICEDYAKYKIIYQDRYFKCLTNDSEDYSFPCLDYVADFRRFLTPAILEVDYDCSRCSRFNTAPDYGYLPYEAHPDFLPNIGVFRVFDLYDDYLFVQSDIMAEKKAEEIIAIKRFHSQLKANEFYKKFR